MKPTFRLTLATAALVLSAGLGNAADLKFATGPQGGSWYPLGGAMKALIEKELPDTNVAVAPGGGVANSLAVGTGKADIAFGNSVTSVDAMNGRGPFKQKMTNVCNLGVLYPQYFQVVALASSGVKSGSDMKGKALSTQKRGNTGEAVTADWLKVNDLNYESLSKMNQGSYNDSVNQLKDGNADVFSMTTQVPAGSIMDIASARDVTIVGLSDEEIKKMQEINGGYQKIMIKAGSYPKQDQDVPTVGFFTHVIVPCDMDEATAYGITKAMIDGLDNLSGIAKAIKQNTMQDIARDVGIPMHPGATKLYKEKGAL